MGTVTRRLGGLVTVFLFLQHKMGAGLQYPVESKLLLRRGNDKFRVGMSTMQGYRKEMEDTHTIKLNLDKHKDIAMFGVFDGHNGSEAAEYCAKDLHTRIDNIDPFDADQITKAVLEADKEFLNMKQQSRSGATAVWATIKPSNTEYDISISNIGDSRCLLISKDCKLIFSTVDHKPSCEGETKRIEAAGGKVVVDRVNGALGLSRSIGDARYKDDTSRAPELQKVISIPDVTRHKLHKDDMVFIACDGIFERITTEQLINHLKRLIEKFPDDPAIVVQQILDICLRSGSKDNMSAVLIFLKDGTGYEKEDQFVPGQFYRQKHSADFVDAYQKDAKKYGYEGDQLIKMANQASLDQINREIRFVSQHEELEHVHKQLQNVKAKLEVELSK